MTGPYKAAIALGVAMGLLAGVGGYTFIYAKGASYITNDPEACANCHVMDAYYNAWIKGSHHAVAVCNDCHTPHNLPRKLLTKAANGYHHSLAFTTGRFHEPIQITPHNREITEEACRYCHQEIVSAIDMNHEGEDTLSCIRCHSTVGHWE